MMRNKTYTAINVIGLAVGLSCFIMISLYVLDELSYDRFNVNARRIYRINSDIRFGGGQIHGAISSDMTGQVLKKDYPQVEGFTRIYNSTSYKLVRKGNAFIKEENIANVDSSFFDVFTFPAIAGNTHTALRDPYTVVITKSTAEKYFGTTDVIGKTIETPGDNKTDVDKITAVIKDMPKNCHFNFDFLFSMRSVNYQWGQFTSHNFHTYLLLAKGTDYRKFEINFDEYIIRYVLPFAQQFMRVSSMEEFKKAGNILEYSLIPLTKIHLYSDYQYELAPNGNIEYVYIFGAVALFILLIACVNFMNLTTARSANRAKEVGIRKVLGTERKNLVLQFLSESVLTVLLSLVISVGIAWAMIPYFNRLANKEISILDLFTPMLILCLVALPLVVGLIAGSYPAFFLSGFKPVEVLKRRAGSIQKACLRLFFTANKTMFIFKQAECIVILRIYSFTCIVISGRVNLYQNRTVLVSKTN